MIGAAGYYIRPVCDHVAHIYITAAGAHEGDAQFGVLVSYPVTGFGFRNFKRAVSPFDHLRGVYQADGGDVVVLVGVNNGIGVILRVQGEGEGFGEFGFLVAIDP